MAQKLFILFGATGSLSRLKIFPSLSNLYQNKELDGVRVLAYGRKDFDNDSFREYLSHIPNVQREFVSSVEYLVGDTTDSSNIRNYILNNNFKKIYCYLSLPPNMYLQAIDFIGKFALDLEYRVALEKPFGTSLEDSAILEAKINSIGKSNFYLVDHYLAKEAVINIPNNIDFQRISKIDISIFEEGGIDGRETFYDQTGATIDTVQNHILNTLSKLIPDFLNKLKYKENSLILGQYEGYKDLPGVDSKSKTETYFKADFEYKNIKVSMRSGKAMNETKAVISIGYKNGKTKVIYIKPNPKEIVTPHEYIINDFLAETKNFEVPLVDTLLAWRIVDLVLKDKEVVKIKHYIKGSKYSDIER